MQLDSGRGRIWTRQPVFSPSILSQLPPWEGQEGDSSEQHRCHPCPQGAYRLGGKISFEQITFPKGIPVQVEVEGEEAIKQVRERKGGPSQQWNSMRESSKAERGWQSQAVIRLRPGQVDDSEEL